MTKIDKDNIKRIYNYSLRSIAAFCSARKDLKTLCLKLSYIGIHTIPVLYSPNSESKTSFCFSFILGHNKFMFECLVALL